MRSFIRSYDSATFVKTLATLSVFSASVTVSNPKCVVFAPTEPFSGEDGACVVSRRCLDVEKLLQPVWLGAILDKWV